MRYVLLFCVAMMMAGCTTTNRHASVNPTEIHDIRASGTYHTVRAGETLWQISKQYTVDVDTLARTNTLSDSAVLEKGQVLIIPSIRRQTSRTNYLAKEPFTWPLRGAVISTYGAKVDKARNKGIDISSPEGDPVRAARTGVVVYSDEKLKGFGKTLILDHGSSFQTVYAYNSDILVKVGESVKRNDIIARVGRTGRAKVPSLHFEIRKNGEPRNPYFYLPQ